MLQRLSLEGDDASTSVGACIGVGFPAEVGGWVILLGDAEEAGEGFLAVIEEYCCEGVGDYSKVIEYVNLCLLMSHIVWDDGEVEMDVGRVRGISTTIGVAFEDGGYLIG